MARYQAEDVTSIKAEVGERLEIESLHEAVVPTTLMAVPFWELPEMLELEGQEPFPGEGVHGTTAAVRVLCEGSGDLVLGFRDLRTNEVIRHKRIRVEITEA